MADYVKCPACGFDRTREEFTRPLDVPWRAHATGSVRRAGTCYYCRQRNAFDEAYARQWDWAAALNKATAMSVASRNSLDGIWGNITPHLIRVLDVVQEDKCALTGQQFLRPKESELTARATMAGWANKLPYQDRGRVPVLVRISHEHQWDSGNVMLIIAAAETLYRYCGGLVGFRYTIKDTMDHRTLMPARDVLEHTSNKLYIEQFEIWKKINNERIERDNEPD